MIGPEGYFLLERGGDQGPLTDAQLKAPHVVGQTIRVPWSAINPAPGEYIFDEITERLTQCRRTDRKAKLLIQTGRDGYSPEWIGGQWIQDGRNGPKAPAPWSPDLLAAWGRLWGALGNSYHHNPCIVGVHITGPTWPSAEMHPAPGLRTKKGYSQAAMIQAWFNAGMIVAARFPNVAACLSISVQDEANLYVRDVIGELHDELGDQLRLQHNALAAKTKPTAPHHRLIADCHRMKGIGVGFEMLCTVKERVRFGSSNIMDGINIGKAAGGEWFDVYPQPQDIRGLR